jgi:hypothetical protein
MSSHRTARACYAFAALTFASGVYFAVHRSWLCLCGFYGSALFLWLAARLRADHRHQLVRHERARRAAIVDGLLLRQSAPAPCCSFWTSSNGAVHGPDCTRPPDARRDDYRLDAAGRTAFEEIAARFDDRSAA